MKHSIFKQTIVIFCLAIVLASALTAVISFSYSARYTANRADHSASAGASIAARVIEGVDYDALCKSDTSDLYRKTRSDLRSICEGFGLEYLYLYEVLPGSDRIRYIMTAALGEAHDEVVDDERGLGKVVSHTLTQEEKIALSGATNSQASVVKNRFGEVYTWIYPVYRDGRVAALIGSDYRTDDLLRHVIRGMVVTIFPMVAVLVLTFLGVLFSMRKRIFIPIKRLSVCMNRFVADRGSDEGILDIRSDNEIGEMANSFVQMGADIKKYLADIRTLTAERARAGVELDVARRIQNGIVPVETALADESCDIFACAKAAREVGGDFYDCFHTVDGKVCALIGDVSGKGIAAAMFMVMTKTMLHDCLNGGCDPAFALRSVNDSLCRSNPEGMFATVFAALLDPETGEVCFANAGHTKPVVLKADATFLKMDSGIALGLFEDVDIADQYVTLNKGEGLLLYTDGVTEAIDPQRTFFGEKRLLEAAQRTENARDMIRAVENRVFEFVSGAEQFDDFTALAMYYEGSPITILQLAPVEDSLPELRQAILGIAGDTAGGRKIYLACDEVFVNIVGYANASQVEVEIRKQNGVLTVTFSDDGIPFNPTAQTKKKEFEELDGGGMGISLVRQIADKMSYTWEDDKNKLTLTFMGNRKDE